MPKKLYIKTHGCQMNEYDSEKMSKLLVDKKNFEIIGSAHNLKEIKLKELQNIKEIFISPLFKDKTNKQLSIYRYLKLKKATLMKDISLGGINEKNFKRLKLIRPYGFAGISFFDKKKGP